MEVELFFSLDIVGFPLEFLVAVDRRNFALRLVNRMIARSFSDACSGAGRLLQLLPAPEGQNSNELWAAG